MLADRRIERGVVGRVEHVAVAAGDGDEVDVGLETRGHGPHHVAHIEDIDILVNKDDVLELGECREGEHGGVALTALVIFARLLKLHDGNELAAAAGGSVDVEQAARDGGLDHLVDGSLGGDAGHGNVLVRRADAALHDGIDARGDGGDLDHRADLGAAGVAGELGHGVAVAVDVLVDGLVVHEVALEHVLGIGDALLRNGDAVGKLDSVAAQGAGNLQLVEAERCGGSLKTAAHVHGGVQTDGDGDGHILATLAVLVKERAQVTAAGGNPHGKLILVDAGEAVDGHVGLGAIGARAVGEAHGDVGAAVDGRVGGSGNDLAQVKALVGRLVHDLLAVDMLALGDLLGRDQVLEALTDLEAQVLLVQIEQGGNALAAGKHADADLGIVKALDVVEDHRRTLFGRTHNGAAGTDVAIDARDLGVRVDLGVGLEQLARHLAQKVECGAQVVDLGSIGSGHSMLLSGECPAAGMPPGWVT